LESGAGRRYARHVNELPQGTVTLLFTDMEGSTRLLKQLRERYGELLADHHRLMRDALDEHRGREVDTQGEAFFAVFPRAKDAVRAAVAALRSHASHEWPGNVDVRVRMALHTAEPEVVGDRYFGLGVHRAARLCAVGHGCQILLSRSTAGLVDEDEVPDVGVRDLGEHELKDLDRPERIYQVVADGLPDEFPALKTMSEAIRASATAAWTSGTLTFLATDIVGSTALLRQLGRERYGELLDAYEHVLRPVFAHANGHEIDVVGDSFLVVFRTAESAVAAAGHAQRELAEMRWPHDAAPSVRIGIHTGEAARTRTRYVGIALHRALRVCNAALGGQVLVSDATQSVLDVHELGADLRDRGEQRLRDFDHAVRLYELVPAAATTPAPSP
jgi:class 3 adenylate cyclase